MFLTLDEAAFVSENVFIYVILPMIIQKGCCVALTTTPRPEGNWISSMALSAEKIKCVANVIHVGKPCKECYDEGREAYCMHQKSLPWKDPVLQEKIGTHLLGNRASSHLQEQYATINESSQKNFSKALINRLFSHEKPFKSKPDFLYFMVDPSGGGKSDVGIVGGYFADNALNVSIVFIFFFSCDYHYHYFFLQV